MPPLAHWYAPSASVRATGARETVANEPDGVGRKLGATEPDGAFDGEEESVDMTVTDGRRVATGVNDGYLEEVGPSDGFELGFRVLRGRGLRDGVVE